MAMENNIIDEGLERLFENYDIFEEIEYDALNDETFGSEATNDDWEQNHEKLAQITESSRPQNQTASCKKNGVNIDVEDNLSHLVLDEKEGIVPRPGVWDSPSSVSLPKPRFPLSLPSTVTNVRTLQELEKGFIANRPPPGLTKPSQTQQKADGSLLLNTLSTHEKFQINGLPSPRFPPGLGIPGQHPGVPPNVRLPPPFFMQHPGLLPNQPGNMLRYPLPPHLMLPYGGQRPPLPGSFSGNFPPPPNTGPSFVRPNHGMMPGFHNNQANHYQQQQHFILHFGNQRIQSRTFHHGDQQGARQPFFKNNQYIHRSHDQNNQQHYYQHHPPGVNGMSGSEEYDEYAGLMSSREKQWLINIQLLQLNTTEPYVDDYYYTVFCDRQNKQSAKKDQKDKKYFNNNGYHKDSREREQPHHGLTKVVYIPAQFENSLGKLQFASVTAPRKIIDMDVVPNSDPQSASQIQQKDTKKTRQLLLEIERLYTVQLKLEDLSNPLAQVTEQQNAGNENETVVVKKTTPELISIMVTSLLQLTQDDKLASALSIRKGKALLLRFLPHLNVTEYQNQLEELWTVILKGLAIIGRRDPYLLTSFYSEFRRWLDAVEDFTKIVRLARALSDSASQSSKNNSLAFALVNKFGVSVIASMLEQAEQLNPAEDALSPEWSSFIVAIAELIGDNLPCVAPCQPIAANTLKKHLNRISSLKVESHVALERLLTDSNPSTTPTP
ncbi:hypothetical protein KM043_004259 [Ampulex compressa]|nr:hypothetical protein KM043_004259 [Ampulex compressa]